MHSDIRLVPSTPPPILHQNSTDVPFVALDALQAAGDQGAFRGRKFHSQNEVSLQRCHSQKIVGSESVNSCSYMGVSKNSGTHKSSI